MENLTVFWNSSGMDFEAVLLTVPTILVISIIILLEARKSRDLILMAFMSVLITILYIGIGNFNSLASEMIFSAKLLSMIWFIVTIIILLFALISSGKSRKTEDLEEEKNDRH